MTSILTLFPYTLNDSKNVMTIDLFFTIFGMGIMWPHALFFYKMFQRIIEITIVLLKHYSNIVITQIEIWNIS